jgi:hypothetical protein
MDGFSLASVVLSYFLIGGGMFTGMLVGSVLEVNNEIVTYALLGAGAFVGGFVAARASRGSTILEPAIGAVALVGTIVGLAATTALGKIMWAMAHDETVRLVAGVGLTSLAGAIVGAFISERVFGEATESPLPWIIYTAFSVFGACLVALLIVAVVIKGDADESANHLGVRVIAAIGVGCLLAGMAVGASARMRPLGAAFLGGGIGVAGFFYLFLRMNGVPLNGDALAGLAILGGGGAVVTLIGAAIGWGVAGRNG